MELYSSDLTDASVSTITCPFCGHSAVETMPTLACQYFYDCRGCRAVLRPKSGDCCVFCSYGDRGCPPKQEECCAHDKLRPMDGSP